MSCIHELFEAQVERAPEAIAVVLGDQSLTYRELNSRADILAHRLRNRGVGRDCLVALYVERSLDMVVGMLGVLKAGGAYVPLDPSHPPRRLADILEDAGPLVIVTQKKLRVGLLPHRAPLIAIDDTAAPPVEPVPGNEVSSARDLAYVIYTSGSTGAPKGVEIEHGAVVNLLTSMQNQPGLHADDVMLAITTLAFDIHVLEIFLPLICGARVVIAPSDLVSDGEALANLIAKSGVSVVQATPATLRMLLDAGWQGDARLKILCGGEAWTTELADELLPRCGSLWNMYGPTETTVWSAIAKVEAGRPIVIGQPIAKTQLHVRDGKWQPVPVDEVGELLIGGAGLARGYLYRPELTRERFVPDPTAMDPGARLYRTGDLVRCRPDGTFQFLGRVDHQVKVRGHRIELGEVEAVLARAPGIKQCAVAACEDKHKQPQLVGYFIPVEGATVLPAELRLALGQSLPSYMIPSTFVSLARFPLTPNGKLDRKALPSPDVVAGKIDAEPLEPRTPNEKLLHRIWCKVLERKQIGIHDNFFDLGGHSLMAVRVTGEINKALKLRLTVPTFFQNPTIEQLAGAIDQKNRGSSSHVLPLEGGLKDLPIYFISAGGAEYQIAESIGGKRTSFAVDPPLPREWVQALKARTSTALPSIEQLGQLYGDLLYAHVGSTPCVVAGFSLGGKIAFEAARTLQQAGGKLAFVLLLDAWGNTPNGVLPDSASGRLQSIWRSAMSGTAGGDSQIRRLVEAVGRSWGLLPLMLGRISQFGQRLQGKPSYFLDEAGQPIDQKLIDRMARAAGQSWRPRPLDAKGVLIRASNYPGGYMPQPDPTNGWHDLFAAGLDILQATGDHLSMVSHENIGELGRQISHVLDQLDPDRPDTAETVAPPSLARDVAAA